MSKEQAFEIVVASDIEYDTLLAEVYIDGSVCVLVTASSDEGRFDVIIRDRYLAPENAVNRVESELLCNAIEAAKSRLRNRRQDEIDKLFNFE